MNKIVNTGMKIDLHIHSCASSKKDGNKVKKYYTKYFHACEKFR